MEIVHFLLPFRLSPFNYEILPTVFFVVIWGLFVFTVVSIYRMANEINWEKRWSLDSKCKLDAEHSSVMEVCEAVATGAEKSANIMPGTLLIIGLLGTFVGLGLALDKASLILLDSATADNIDSSISSLMGMLEGLGSKFKTSTWGLLAFILLKVVLSAHGYEEKRLRWSIEKINNELNSVRDIERQEVRANNQKLVDCMQDIAQHFKATLIASQSDKFKQFQQMVSLNREVIEVIKDGGRAQLNRLAEQESSLVDVLTLNLNKQQEFIDDARRNNTILENSLVQQFKALSGILSEHHDASQEGLRAQLKYLADQEKSVVGSLNASISKQQELINEIRSNTKGLEGFMGEQFNVLSGVLNEHHNTSQAGRQEQLKRMAGQEKNIVDLLKISISKQQELTEGLTRFGEAFSSVIVENFDNLKSVLSGHNRSVSSLLQDNVMQSKETRDAMVGFVEKNESTVVMLGKSAEGMSRATGNMSSAAEVMAGAANHLQGVIDKFRVNMEQVVDLMKKDLNTTITGMNTSFSKNMTGMSDNLKDSIGNMSDSFRHNMSEMSKGLGKATGDISNAVNSLSKSVDATMTKVVKTIDDSMDLQKKSQKEFIVSTNTLNDYVNQMTGLVNKLSDDIVGGLRAVSESNLRMKSVANNLEGLMATVPESNEKMDDVVNHVRQLTSSISGYLDELSTSAQAVLQLKPVLEGLKVSIESQSDALLFAVNSSIGKE